MCPALRFCTSMVKFIVSIRNKCYKELTLTTQFKPIGPQNFYFQIEQGGLISQVAIWRIFGYLSQGFFIQMATSSTPSGNCWHLRACNDLRHSRAMMSHDFKSNFSSFTPKISSQNKLYKNFSCEVQGKLNLANDFSNVFWQTNDRNLVTFLKVIT